MTDPPRPITGGRPDPDPVEADVRDALHALRRTETARPTDTIWADITARGRNDAMETKRNRILSIAAAAVLAVVMLGVGIAIGGRSDGSGGGASSDGQQVDVGGTTLPGDQPIRFLPHYRATLDLVHEVTREGTLSVAFMTDPALVSTDQITEQRAATDAAVGRWQANRPEPLNDTVREELTQADSRLSQLAVNRRTTDGTQTDPRATVDSYLQLGDEILGVARAAVMDESSARVAFRISGLLSLGQAELYGFQQMSAILARVGPPSRVVLDQTPAQRREDERQIDQIGQNRDRAMQDFITNSPIAFKQIQRDNFAYSPALEVEVSFSDTVIIAQNEGLEPVFTITARQVVDAAAWQTDAYAKTANDILALLESGTGLEERPMTTGTAVG